MKAELNNLLIALGATQAPIEDEVELTTVTNRMVEHFNAVPEPKKDDDRWWYIVFLQVTPAGPTVGNIIIKGDHPLVWAKKNSSQGSKIVSTLKVADVQVITFFEIDERTAMKLQDDSAKKDT